MTGAALFLCSNSANAGLAVSPSTIANDYVGPIDLTTTGLDSAGQTVVIEEYIDANNSGTINAGDILVRRIQVTDGQVTSIAGHRNLNIPGDEDGSADSQIHTRLILSHGAVVERVDGRYIFRVSPAGGIGFVPFTSSLIVSQKDYSGSGISGATGQAGTIVVFSATPSSGDDATFGVTRADATGNYSMKIAPGTYKVAGFKTGFVFNGGTGPVVTVSAGAFSTNQNLTLAASSRTISGAVRDATSLTGLPGILLQGKSKNGFLSLTFSDASGNYTVDANTGNWTISLYQQLIAQLGYVDFKPSDNTAGNVSGFNIDLPRVTSLIYGTLKTPANIAVPYTDIKGNTNGSPYRSLGISDANGNYTLGVTIGAWVTQFQPPRYLVQDEVVVVNTDGSAIAQDLVANPITAHLRGQIHDNNGNVVGNLTMDAFDTTITNDVNNLESKSNADGNGHFDLPVFGGGGTDTKEWQLQAEFNNGPQNYVATNPTFNIQDGVDINGINYVVYVVTAHLRGQVLDENDSPIGNINISASLNPDDFASQSSNVDSGGNFDLGVFAGNWDLGLFNIEGLGIIPENDPSIDVTDNVDQNNLVFRVRHSTATITGSVKSSAGNAIAGVTVTSTTNLSGTNYSSTTSTDASGNYSLPVFSSTWSVSVDSGGLAAQGYQPVSNQNVFVSGNVTGINFIAITIFNISSITRLSNGHIVLQIAGAPNGSFHIQAAPDPNASSFGPLTPATADNSGAFTYEDTAPGTRRFYRLITP